VKRFGVELACPSCGYKVDAATGVGHDAAPSDGDISICIECCAVNAFVVEDGKLTGYRALSPAELKALPTEIVKTIGRARIAHARVGWRRN